MIDEYTPTQVAELKADPNIDRVYPGRMLQNIHLHKVFDNTHSKYETLLMEEGDDVFVTVDHDGSWYINFLSIFPTTYHYRSLVPTPMADNEFVYILLKEL